MTHESRLGLGRPTSGCTTQSLLPLRASHNGVNLPSLSATPTFSRNRSNRATSASVERAGLRSRWILLVPFFPCEAFLTIRLARPKTRFCATSTCGRNRTPEPVTYGLAGREASLSEHSEAPTGLSGGSDRFRNTQPQ
jgi:hypothetical protein